MRASKVLWWFVILSVMAAAALTGCGDASEVPAGEPGSVDGEALLEERCTECHTLDRVRQAEKDRAGWESTVARMVDQGARLDDAERTVLIDYLVDTYGP